MSQVRHEAANDALVEQLIAELDDRDAEEWRASIDAASTKRRELLDTYDWVFWLIAAVLIAGMLTSPWWWNT